jgi:acyl-CoA synthetase (AMP-forming)/AMP-acid ligase II
MNASNIASTLEKQALKIPGNPAIFAGGRQISFLELHAESSRLASGLKQAGIAPGSRVLLMVPSGIEFIALSFALFKLGAIPVLIDPGIGRKSLLRAIEEIAPSALIGVPRAHLARILFPQAFKKIRIAVTVGRRWFWGGKTLAQVRQMGNPGFDAAPTKMDDLAAILFTSGSTGPAKGVLYTHGMFLSQVALIQNFYGIKPGDVELPTFPLFALFAAGMGMTCVIPDMDATRPARVDPKKIVQAVHDFKITSSFGSPALWDTVTRHCLERGVRLPTIKRILMAGAPVPGSLLKRFDSILETDSEIHTPYGATEALPVASITRTEILRETWSETEKGKGTCVGKAVPGVAVKIIKITDGPIEAWDDGLELRQGEIGEIVAQGPWITREYFREEPTRLAKIKHEKNFWHRMGDVGYLDPQNRLWFCGRKSHRVTTAVGDLYTIPCEAVYNRHPDVKRSALVGIGPKNAQEPVIIIETDSLKDRETLRRELLAMGVKQIRHVLFHREFPVDARHNAKIFREQLAVWAEHKLRP